MAHRTSFGRPADSEPAIVALLRRVRGRGALQPDDDAAVQAVLRQWDTRESLPELRHSLGVAPHRAEGRRRTMRAFKRERAMASTYLQSVLAEHRDPLGTVMRRFFVSDATARRAWREHRNAVTMVHWKLTPRHARTSTFAPLVTHLHSVNKSRFIEHTKRR